MKTWIPDNRKFAYLNWKQVDALPRDKTLLVLPTGAIEQHGHHLPLAMDTLAANLLLGKALQLLPADMHIYALETICYGKSNEHTGFPGTLSMSASTYMAVLHDIGASVAAAGFKKLLFFNCHGGNTALNDVMARDLRSEFGLRTFHMGGGAGAALQGLHPQEKKYGFHAGEVETAWLLAETPELVDTTAYTANYIAQIDDGPAILSPENGAVNFAWLTRDIASSGVLGDPRPATAENGHKWIAACAAKAAEALQAAYNYENLYQP
jgi:creatinine amidohydrolase